MSAVGEWGMCMALIEKSKCHFIIKLRGKTIEEEYSESGIIKAIKQAFSYSSIHRTILVSNINQSIQSNRSLLTHKLLNINFENELLKLKKSRYTNKGLLTFNRKYIQLDPGIVQIFNKMIIDNTNNPTWWPKAVEYDFVFNPDTMLLLVNYPLPSLDYVSYLKIKEIKYNHLNRLVTIKKISHKEFNYLYETLLYQSVLKSIYEIYSYNNHTVIDCVVYNGWVDSIDPATGLFVNKCILSIAANRDEFNQIDLLHVDAKACFRRLKGIAASKLHSLTPIAPILNLRKDDKRFIDSHAIIDSIQEAQNLSSMEWADFEHLIRELFEREFAKFGGEVKVTRASRDGGVDAVAFDPDPIRGGKIVIQAKRYTNTVGVSAVRDLYGTLVNEGAMKGILVTTSDYGPDAFEFAKGKPLTLLNGSNLLHLIQSHGYQAKIDLTESKNLQEKSRRSEIF